jgi:hypothetical protein
MYVALLAACALRDFVSIEVGILYIINMFQPEGENENALVT